MNSQNLPGNVEPVLESFSITDESSLREVLQFCNAEVTAIHQRMERTQEEIDSLSLRIEEAMAKLKAT